jgi:hypothetical protein
VTQQPSRSGPDLIGDLQRWLVRSGARGVSREVSDQLRSVLRRSEGPVDVWERATTAPADEAPECAWCPICRAARALKESGPGVTSQVAAATDALATVAQDTLAAFESALASANRTAKPDAGPAQSPPPSPSPSSATSADVTEQGPADVTEQGPADEPEPTGPPEGPPDEPDDRG